MIGGPGEGRTAPGPAGGGAALRDVHEGEPGAGHRGEPAGGRRGGHHGGHLSGQGGHHSGQNGGRLGGRRGGRRGIDRDIRDEVAEERRAAVAAAGEEHDDAGDVDDIVGMALPLEDEGDLGPLLDRIGDARCVLLGTATHGTHEFYAWRAALTRRLIAEHGFSFVAVEGDWPDCWRLDRCVRLDPKFSSEPFVILDDFRRWPSWMWANAETAHFAQWLREHNAGLPADARVGFFGMDVYSLWNSLREVLGYLSAHAPDSVDAAVAACRCFEPFGDDPRDYARAAPLVPEHCREEVVALLSRLNGPDTSPDSVDPAERFNAWQNAEVAVGAERYYRTLLGGGPESWNVRERHMAATLERLLEFHGPRSRAVVWAHNTHIGDARATDMSLAGMVNLGQLARERWGDDEVVAVGFSTGHGEVVAASGWGAPMEIMTLAPPRPGSLEAVLTDTRLPRALFVIADEPGENWLTDPRGHRAIGVVYDPGRERGNYAPTRLADRYDALCWFARTSALEPWHLEAAQRGELETFPAGV